MDVHAELHHVHRLVVGTLACVTIAVAGLALEPVISSVASPLLLGESILTLLTIDSLGLVLTLTLQDPGVDILGADVSMTIAHAPSTQADLLDGIVVSPGDRVVSLSH